LVVGISAVLNRAPAPARNVPAPPISTTAGNGIELREPVCDQSDTTAKIMCQKQADERKQKAEREKIMRDVDQRVFEIQQDVKRP